MRRRLLNLLTLLSLLLCVAVVVVWVRSYWASDTIKIKHEGRLTNVHSVGGSFRVIVFASPNPFPARFKVRTSEPQPSELARPGLTTFESGADVADGVLYFVAFPQWTVVALCAVLPAARLARQARRDLRHRRGFCPACGYDLTGNVSGACPECGSQR